MTQGIILCSSFSTIWYLPSDGLLETNRITCTAVRVSADMPRVESHLFVGLTTDPSFIAHRADSESSHKSILVGTLLALLRQPLFVGDGVPVNLANILSGASADHEAQITVSTSQMPRFNLEDYQAPAYYYRSLGVLREIQIAFVMPPPIFDRGRELYSIKETGDDSQTSTYFRQWRRFGVDLSECHFVIIFNDASPSTHHRAVMHNWLDRLGGSHPSSSGLDQRQLLGGGSGSDFSRNSPVPALVANPDHMNARASPVLTDIPDLSRAISRASHGHNNTSDFARNSPAPALPVDVNHMNARTTPIFPDIHNIVALAPQPPHGEYAASRSEFSSTTTNTYEDSTSHHSQTVFEPYGIQSALHPQAFDMNATLHFSDSVVHATNVDVEQACDFKFEDIERICSAQHIPGHVVHHARFSDDNRVATLYAKALVHKSVAQILVKLGLQQEIYDKFSVKADRCLNIGGISVSTHSVLKALSWKRETYKHRCNWFGWANNLVLTKQWKTTLGVPSGASLSISLKIILTSFRSEDEPSFAYYKLWRVMECVWAPGGMLETGSLAHADSTVKDWLEHSKQAHLAAAHKNSTEFLTYIEDRI